MKKTKIIMSTIIAASILLGGVVNANAKVESYVIKDNDKLYKYNISDLFYNNNFKLLSEFFENAKKNNISMVKDDEVSKYFDYNSMKFNEEKLGKDFNYNIYTIVNSGVDKPKYIYDRIEKNNVIVNKLNISGDNLNIDFTKEKFEQFDDITITGKNIAINNLNIKGTVEINTIEKGNVTLNNVTSSVIDVLKTSQEPLDLINVVSNKLIVSNEKGSIINLKGNSKLKETVIEESSKLNNVSGDFGVVTLDIKNKESNKVELNGQFSKVVVNSGKGLLLGKGAKIDELKANSNIEIVKDSKAIIKNMQKDKNAIVKNTIDVKEEKDRISNDIVTSVNESKSTPGGNGNKSEESKNTSNNSGNKVEVITNNPNKNEDKDKKPGNSSIDNLNTEFNVIDKDKSCIMNIQFVNYAVVVLSEGAINDYKFFIDGTEINPIKVNEEGTILKFELVNRKNKELKVVKSGKEEKFTLKYKQY